MPYSAWRLSKVTGRGGRKQTVARERQSGAVWGRELEGALGAGTALVIL